MKPQLLLTLLLAALASGAAADEEPAEELLHSDRPLWTSGEDMWPQHFADQEGFGCANRIHLGTWRYDEANAESNDPVWFSFTNYGVFHCWMNVSQGYDQAELGQSRPGFLIDLGKRVEGRELWALQLGARPGADYLLLARVPDPGPIRSFEVLQRDCSTGQVRGGPSLDIIITRYCYLPSRSALVALAKRMGRKPPLGTLTFAEVGPSEEN